MKVVKLWEVLLLFIHLQSLICLPLEDPVEIKSFKHEMLQDSYYFSYQLSDGQEREEKGEFYQTDGTKIYRVKGSYTFLGTDNVLYQVMFTADDKGFNPKITRKIPDESERTEFEVDERIDPQVVKTLLG